MFIIGSGMDSTPPQKKEPPGFVLIYAHIASFVEFDASLFEYTNRVDDSRLSNSAELIQNRTFLDIFRELLGNALNQLKPIIVFSYHPLIGQFMSTFLPEFCKVEQCKVLCLSFFHNDTDTKKIKIDGVSNILDAKAEILKDMNKHHYIKKLFIPKSYKVDLDYMNMILNEPLQ